MKNNRFEESFMAAVSCHDPYWSFSLCWRRLPVVESQTVMSVIAVRKVASILGRRRGFPAVVAGEAGQSEAADFVAGRACRGVAAASGAAQRRHVCAVRWYQTLFHTLLLFHSPILEPDLHLRLVELQRRRDLDAPRSRQVLVEVELLLQLGQLLVRKIRATCVIETTRDSSQWADDAVYRTTGGGCIHRRARPRGCAATELDVGVRFRRWNRFGIVVMTIQSTFHSGEAIVNVHPEEEMSAVIIKIFMECKTQ